jgi:uncharacterized integral membrane protein (TIGR00698 family)
MAAGTAICGASAIIASNEIVRGSEEDVAFTLISVTFFGTIAMFVYPLIGGWLDLGSTAYGLWAGASIHEVAQVVAATFERGAVAAEYGTIAKLGRVAMLPHGLLFLSALMAREQPACQRIRDTHSVPIFIFGFVAAVAVTSLGILPSWLVQGCSASAPFLLIVAVTALGLMTSFAKLGSHGFRPILLGAGAALTIAAVGLISTGLLHRFGP